MMADCIPSVADTLQSMGSDCDPETLSDEAFLRLRHAGQRRLMREMEKGQDELLSILCSLGLEKYSWHLRSCGRTTVQDFAHLRSTDELPESIPEHVKAKLVAHARSFAILCAAGGQMQEPMSQAPQYAQGKRRSSLFRSMKPPVAKL